MAKSLRQTYTLSSTEKHELDSLAYKPAVPEVAFSFWRKVAAARGLDPKSLLNNIIKRDEFTGLPCDHGKPWCYPMPLICQQKVSPHD